MGTGVPPQVQKAMVLLASVLGHTSIASSVGMNTHSPCLRRKSKEELVCTGLHESIEAGVFDDLS